MMVAAKKAFDDITAESDLSMAQRFDNLLQAMVVNSFAYIDRMKNGGDPPSDEEKNIQKESMKQLLIIEKCFAMAKRQGRINDDPSESFDNELLGKIRKLKGSVGEIVTAIPQNAQL